MKFRLTSLWMVIGLGLAVAGLSGCRDTSNAGAAKPPPGPVRIAVSVASAHELTLERTAEAQGALFPKEQATVAAEVYGSVSEILADFGDSVKAGQLMLKIAPREYQLKVDSAKAALDQARARMKNSRASYRRALELKRQGTMAAAEFERITAALRVDEANVESAENGLALARKKLADTRVKAPFKGYVQKRLVSLGEYVTAGRKLYELIATDPIKLRAAIPERFVPRVKPGIEVHLTVEARPGRVYSGAVTRIAPALDANSRTLLVEAEVRNPEGVLKPGYFAHVTMDLGKDRALFVPRSAVLRYAGVARVFVIKKGVAHAREVTTGTLLGEQIEISKGLEPGESVATTAVDRLADGAAVTAEGQT